MLEKYEQAITKPHLVRSRGEDPRETATRKEERRGNHKQQNIADSSSVEVDINYLLQNEELIRQQQQILDKLSFKKTKKHAIGDSMYPAVAAAPEAASDDRGQRSRTLQSERTTSEIKLRPLSRSEALALKAILKMEKQRRSQDLMASNDVDSLS